MSFNLIMAYIGKFTILALYVITLTKFNKAKKYDATIKLRLNTRSWIELIAVGILNIAAIAYPVSEANAGSVAIFVFIALLVTTFHTRRIVAYGKKVIFILEHSFLIKDITKAKYNNGLLTFLIKGRAFKLRLPLANTDLLIEKLSGKMKR